MKLLYYVFLLYLLLLFVNNTSLTTTSQTKTKTLSKAEIEELEKLEKAKLANLELEKAKLEAEVRQRLSSKPTEDEIEMMSPEQRKELLAKAEKEEAGKQSIKNVPIVSLFGDTYWQGWVKYFHYKNDEKIDKPNHFYENPSFFTEVVKFENKNDRSIEGNFKYIQDKYHFWCKLLANGNLNILGSRRNEKNTMADNVENLNTDLINYINPTNNASGAIKDLGSFNEGHCISIATVVPDPKKDLDYNPRTQSGNEESWIICTDKESEKKKLMSFLVSMKIQRQKNIDDYGLVETNKHLSVAELMQMKPFEPKIDRYAGRGASPDDGYWILLQDWSECSLKCGGGEKVQQWMCVPPKNQGKPCIGDSMRKKPCNQEACPEIGKTGAVSLKSDSTHITLKPIYKAMPYSKRPQQYIKCYIKENDVLYKTNEYDPQKKLVSKVPGRIVMNTKTISVYKDDGYANMLFSFNLDETVFAKSEKDFCCFMLINANRQFEMCGFNNNCGSPENPVWVAKWGFDFEYFQRKCYQELKETPARPELAKGQTGASNGGDNTVPLSPEQKEIVEGRRAIISRKIEENIQQRMDEKVGTTQKVALTALRREINLEDLIKNEEIQKGRDETQQLFQQMTQEKKKKKLLEQALQTRESNFGKVRIAKDTQRKIDNIKHEAKVDIDFKRGVLKKKIEEIRNKFRRKHRQIKQQIQMIRAEMANEIVVANKNGDENYCRDGRNDPAKMKEYCDKNFATDYAKNSSCKEPQNFCYSCCDSEFGNMFISERDDCQTMCDDLDKKDLEHGDWVWTNGVLSDAKK